MTLSLLYKHLVWRIRNEQILLPLLKQYFLHDFSPDIVFVGILFVTILIAVFITNNAAAALISPLEYGLVAFNTTPYRWRDFIVTRLLLSITYIITCITVVLMMYPF